MPITALCLRCAHFVVVYYSDSLGHAGRAVTLATGKQTIYGSHEGVNTACTTNLPRNIHAHVWADQNRYW